MKQRKLRGEPLEWRELLAAVSVNSISVPVGTPTVQVPILISPTTQNETIGAMNISFAVGTAGNAIGIINSGAEFTGSIWSAPGNSVFGLPGTPRTHNVQSAATMLSPLQVPANGTVITYTLNTATLPSGSYALDPNFLVMGAGTSADTPITSFTGGILTIGSPTNVPPIVNNQTFFVNENSAFGVSVGNISAFDPDGQIASYSAPGAGPAFAVNSQTGQITVANSSLLDFETTPSFSFTTTVTDNIGATDTATITVNLNDLPETPGGPGSLVVNATPGTINEGQTVSLTGSFSGSNVSHTVNLTWGDGQSENFVLSPGMQSFARNHLYADDNPSGTSQDSYPISVTVTQQGGSSTSNNSQSVLVQNLAPSISSLSLSPNSVLSGQSVLISGTVVDPGAPDTHSVDVDLNGDGSFETTNLTVTGGTFSHSLPVNLAPGTYQSAIRVKDDDGGFSTTTRTLTVNPGGTSNLPPNVNDQTFFINENSFIGTVVGTVIATDPNTTPPENTLSFSLSPTGNTGNALAIHPTTGQLTVNNQAALDFETTPTFLLTVQVNDGGNPSLSDTATITVNLNDLPDTPGSGGLVVNVMPGTINEGQTVNVTGSFSGNLVSHTVNILWGDGQSETFVLPPGIQNFVRNHFYADDNPSNTSQDSYAISVTVTNQQGFLATNNTQSVLVQNVPPSFSSLALTPTSVLGGQNVNVSGTITDPGSLDTHSVDVDLDGDGTFESTGLTVTAGGFSHNLPVVLAPGTYQAVMRVRDDDNGSSTTARTLIVNPGGTGNLPPVVSDQTFSIGENSPFGTVVGTVVATDADPSPPNNTLTYAITGGNTSNAFAINSASGQLTVNSQAALDFETTPTFSLTVQVNDGGTPSFSDSATVTVNLNDLPDTPNTGNLMVNVVPGTINEGQSVTLTSSFSGNAVNHAVSLFWGDGQSESFVLPPGVQSFSRSHFFLDDNPSGTSQDTYTVLVTVTDQQGFSATNNSQSVLVNNLAPSFSSLSLSPSSVLPGENIVIEGTIVDPSALDTHFIDVDLNGDGTFETVNLSVTGGTFSHSFPISQAPGTYQVGVRVRDDDGGLATATRTLTVAPGETFVEDVHVFYNNSRWDNNGAAVTVADFDAIAPDKDPLEFGETGGFVNISGYSRGLNGLFFDIQKLPAGGAGIDAADFMFMVGNDNSPQDWGNAPAPTAVGVFPTAGVAGSDRVYVTFADGAIMDAWLWIIVKANADTGLPANANYFYGAAPGETGAGFTPTVVGVDAADFQSIAEELTPLASFGTEPINQPNDLNRDRTVDAFDFQAVALNLDTIVINYITPQLAAMGSASAATPLALVERPSGHNAPDDQASSAKDALFGQAFSADGLQDERVGNLLSSARERALALLATGNDAEAVAVLPLVLENPETDWQVRV